MHSFACNLVRLMLMSRCVSSSHVHRSRHNVKRVDMICRKADARVAHLDFQLQSLV